MNAIPTFAVPLFFIWYVIGISLDEGLAASNTNEPTHLLSSLHRPNDW